MADVLQKVISVSVDCNKCKISDTDFTICCGDLAARMEMLLPVTTLFPLQKYFKDCVFDLCELEGAKPILCEAIEAYVNECQDRGVNIRPWRNETFCRKCHRTKRRGQNKWMEESSEGYHRD